MADEVYKKFVENMVESSKKKFEAAKPNNPVEADVEEIENLTEDIRKKIQQG